MGAEKTLGWNFPLEEAVNFTFMGRFFSLNIMISSVMETWNLPNKQIEEDKFSIFKVKNVVTHSESEWETLVSELDGVTGIVKESLRVKGSKFLQCSVLCIRLLTHCKCGYRFHLTPLHPIKCELLRFQKLWVIQRSLLSIKPPWRNGLVCDIVLFTLDVWQFLQRLFVFGYRSRYSLLQLLTARPY